MALGVSEGCDPAVKFSRRMCDSQGRQRLGDSAVVRGIYAAAVVC